MWVSVLLFQNVCFLSLTFGVTLEIIFNLHGCIIGIKLYIVLTAHSNALLIYERQMYIFRLINRTNMRVHTTNSIPHQPYIPIFYNTKSACICSPWILLNIHYFKPCITNHIQFIHSFNWYRIEFHSHAKKNIRPQNFNRKVTLSAHHHSHLLL